jgi:vanillate O-demethylase ferredoxin subunit
MITRPLVVARKFLEAENIWRFDLADPAGAALAPYEAGAHIDVHVPGGPVRQYSLCNTFGPTNIYQIAILREPASRGGSATLCDFVGEGDTLAVGKPRNHFGLARMGGNPLFLAGGIGVTPILAMAEALAARNEAFEMHYCTRSPARTAFRSRIEASPFTRNVHFHFDDGPESQQLDLAACFARCEVGRRLYACGPSGFLDWVLTSARAAGWSDDRLHYEHFANNALGLEAGGGFDLVLARSGRHCRVEPDETIAEALERIGISVVTSCGQGVCGICQTTVLEGEPEHRDLYLTAAEQASNKTIMPCCSRARSSRLVLDL